MPTGSGLVGDCIPSERFVTGTNCCGTGGFVLGGDGGRLVGDCEREREGDGDLEAATTIVAPAADDEPAPAR